MIRDALLVETGPGLEPGHAASVRVQANGGRLRLATVCAAFLLLFWSCLPPFHAAAGWELSSEPDEAAHYVTALMIRDYVAGGFPGPPRSFAEEFYLHYPKVAFGMWPPLFHLLLGGWMLVVGVSAWSALLFAAVTTTVLALMIFGAAKQSLGVPLALATAGWFVALPSVRASNGTVMMDALAAFWMFTAALAFGRYLETPRPRLAVLFALLASAGILTKYNALALALVPPIAVVCARKWEVVRRWDFWAMPLIVAGSSAPWYVLQWRMVLYAADPGTSPFHWFRAAHGTMLVLLEQPAVLIALPFAAVGIYVLVLQRSGPERATGCSLFALLVAIPLFHTFIYPIPGGRYLLGAFAAVGIFAAAGLHAAIGRFRFEGCEPAFAGRLGAVALVTLTFASLKPIPQTNRGFAEAARLVLASPERTEGTMLVASDGMGEGGFVAEIATRETRPGSIVLRASKLLSTGTWMLDHYRPRYNTAAEVLGALDRARVEHVVLDDQPTFVHQCLLAEALAGSTDWRLVRRVRASRPGTSDVRIYARSRTLAPGKPEIEVDMQYSLGYSLRR